MGANPAILFGMRTFAVLALFPGCAPTGTNEMTAAAAPLVNQLAKATVSWNGATLPEYLKGQPEITILEITIPPGARLATHGHPVINAGVMLSGELTVVTTNGESLHLQAGDPIVEVVDTLHYGMNAGSVPTKLVVFYAGVEGVPITVAAHGSRPSGAE